MRYQSTPEKEFDGDIIITDPCYIIRNENGITKNDWHFLWCIPAGIFVGVWAYQEFFDF